MREFKPMVKMETTEPTVELKLKKGGAVEKKMARGGAPMGAMIGAPKGGMMAGAKPKKPSLAARRRAMMASGAAGAPSGRAEAMMAAMPAMKKGGEMESPKAHKAEMKQLSGLKKELTKHEKMPASKGHRGLKAGGAAKKFAEGGRVQHDGGPEQMKQGKKKPASPVSINQLSGTYKKGGAVMMANGGATNTAARTAANLAAQKASSQKAAAERALAQRVVSQRVASQAAADKASRAAALKPRITPQITRSLPVQERAEAAKQAAAQKAAAERASAERAMAQKASQSQEAARRVAADKASIQKASMDKASRDAAVKPQITVSLRVTRSLPVRPEIQYTGPKSAGTIYPDGSDSGKNPGVPVSQTPAVPPMPKPVPTLSPKPVPSGKYDRPIVPSVDPSIQRPMPLPRVESTAYRRGGKVQNNRKNRGGAVC